MHTNFHFDLCSNYQTCYRFDFCYDFCSKRNQIVDPKMMTSEGIEENMKTLGKEQCHLNEGYHLHQVNMSPLNNHCHANWTHH